MKITLSARGEYNKVERWLNKLRNKEYLNILDKYGHKGVDALSSATPVDSGKTAASWGYEIHHSRSTTTITWTNTNINDGVPIAIILQYGHGTGTGGYVAGRDYINPALRPIFDAMAEEAWREVSKI